MITKNNEIIKSKINNNVYFKKNYKRKLENKKFTKMVYNSNIFKDSVYSRIDNCSSYVEFLVDKNIDNIKLDRTFLCGNRFCPICSVNNSRKNAEILLNVFNYLESDFSFLFLTLTVPNVDGLILENKIDEMNAAFKRFTERKIFKNIIKGYVRKLEVTYNKDRDDYHPHFHVLIAVNKSYFNDSKSYLKHDLWLKNWQEVMNDFTINQVRIEKFKKSKKGGLHEITKYVTKKEDYTFSLEVFKNFYNALFRKKFLTYSGVFKDALKKYNNNEIERKKLDEDFEAEFIFSFSWSKDKYLLNDISKIK